VDRFGQPAECVRSIMMFSPDSAIDGAVLEVILRKAEEIRKATGVTVPLPINGVRGRNQLDCTSEGVRIDERVTVARVFTREQFYELVWSKPMTHLAKEFAISDVALHKICRKHGIPNPPLGWWAKKAAGKKVKQTPLPEAKPGAPDRITISDGELGRESANLAAAREQARIQASGGDDNEAVPPHPIVERTIAALRKAKPSDIGLIAVSEGGLVKCEVAPRSVDRLAVILPRIVRAASLQGFQLVGGEGAAHFKSETEVIGFSISELAKREKHVLTDAERTKEEAWQRKRDLAARRNGWGVPDAIPPEACYLGWQESLRNLARLVEPEIAQ